VDEFSFEEERKKRQIAFFMYNHPRLGPNSKLNDIDQELLRQLVFRKHVTLQKPTQYIIEYLRDLEKQRIRFSEFVESDVFTSDWESSSSDDDEEEQRDSDEGGNNSDEAGAAWTHYSSEDEDEQEDFWGLVRS
jgi:hypothetical protein